MAQAILAILLASAIAATLVGRRTNNAVSQGRSVAGVIAGSRDTRFQATRTCTG